ncbi:hypothetical protein ACWGPW_21915 [Paenibacillus chitinolyticus]
MVYAFSCFIVTFLFVFAMKKTDIDNVYSKGLLILIICSLISNISLSENYTHSLIPEVNDGIGISNKVSYWIIGDRGWSQEAFGTLFEWSVYVTMLLVILYMFTVIIEKKKKEKHPTT